MSSAWGRITTWWRPALPTCPVCHCCTAETSSTGNSWRGASKSCPLLATTCPPTAAARGPRPSATMTACSMSLSRCPTKAFLSQLRKIPQARGVSCTASSRPAAGSTPARSGTTTAAPTWPTPTPRAAVASSTASMSAAWPQTQAACWTTESRCSTTS